MKIVQVKIYTKNAFVLYAQLFDGEPPVWSVPKGSHQHHHFKKSVCQNIFIASIRSTFIISVQILHIPYYRSIEGNLFTGSIPPDIRKLINLQKL